LPQTRASGLRRRSHDAGLDAKSLRPGAYATSNARSAASWLEGVRSAEQTEFLDRLDAFVAAARLQLRRGL
jgi:ribosome modulation factor